MIQHHVNSLELVNFDNLHLILYQRLSQAKKLKGSEDTEAPPRWKEIHD